MYSEIRTVTAEVVINFKDGVDWLWYTEPGHEPVWRGDVYGMDTEDDVLNHFAYNAVANGVDRANVLDGWADLEFSDVTFNVLVLEIEE